jgi:hypothetical protein
MNAPSLGFGAAPLTPAIGGSPGIRVMHRAAILGAQE